MSGLIKENVTSCLIVMVRLKHLTFLVTLIVAPLLFSPVNADYLISQDTTAPTIHEWGIEGDPLLGLGFDVWANVSDDEILNDDDPELRNVTVRVSGPNMTLNGLMTFNGTFYTGSVPAFPNDGRFEIRIYAFDLTNNSRNSGVRSYEYEAEPVIPINPNVTMPFVVGGSIGLIAVVIGLAMFYDKRRNPIE